jgi:hypothetical protein
MSLDGGWKHPKHKGGARFALLIVDLYQEAEKPCGVKELIEETGMSKHQVLRIIEDLKASGAVTVEGGKGRAPYIIKLASANEAKMDTQEGSDSKMASLADAVPLCPHNAVRSDSILSGTELAPSKALRTSTDKKLSLSSREAPTEPKRERETRFPLEVREAYAKARGCGDGWLHTARDGRYDDLIERWQSNGTVKPTAEAPAAKISQLPPEEADSLISQAAAMLREGAEIADVDRRLAPLCPRSQWATIRSTAQAQAKVKNVPAANHSPPAAKSANVISINGRAAR